MHRERGPAYIEYKPDGTVFRETWMREGDWHRAPGEGPASTVRQANGITVEHWCVHGQAHRDPNEGAARIFRDKVKGTVREEFLVEGEYRRGCDGPARVYRDAAGNVVEDLYWDGERMHRHPAGDMKVEVSAHG
jgi:hypothetical protein